MSYQHAQDAARAISDKLGFPTTVSICEDKDGFMFRMFFDYPDYVPTYISRQDLDKMNIPFARDMLHSRYTKAMKERVPTA